MIDGDLLFRAIFEGAHDAMLIADGQGRYLDANPAASQLFGVTKELLIGRSVAEFSDDPPAVDLAWQTFLREGSMRGELTLRRDDGTFRQVDFSATANVLPGHHLSVLRDITDRKRSEAQLRQSQKMEAIATLAGGVAHDFNNMLSVILSYTTLILDDVNEGEPIRADLEQIEKAVRRATEVTGQLQAFGRKQLLEPVVLDINEVIDGVVKRLPRVLDDHVQLSFVPNATSCHVHADRTQLEQVLMNLFVNARNAMPSGGALTIATANVILDASQAPKSPGPHVLVSVTDTGGGMEAAVAERVFEPFFTTTGKGKGAGLALSTVYGIVQQSGGQIRVESAVGQGTTFLLSLPVTDRNGGRVL